MADYKALYFHLFNGLTDILSYAEAQESVRVRDKVIQLQRGAEELYLKETDDEK